MIKGVIKLRHSFYFSNVLFLVFCIRIGKALWPILAPPQKKNTNPAQKPGRVLLTPLKIRKKTARITIYCTLLQQSVMLRYDLYYFKILLRIVFVHPGNARPDFLGANRNYAFRFFGTDRCTPCGDGYDYHKNKNLRNPVQPIPSAKAITANKKNI